MALFSKKNCDICGGKIGLLGNRKLDDGNMCKDCAKLLSPFFSDRKRSTVADINEHLAYREENKNAVAAFNVTRTLGKGTKVHLDEDANKFIVTSSNRWQQENPDVIEFSQVTGCDVNVQENQQELKFRDKEGNQVSYNPPRYKYNYDFNMVIFVNSPWFNEIRFKLNNSTISIEPPAGRVIRRGGAELGRSDMNYRACEALGEEIKETLMKVRQDAREEVAAANVPKMAQMCSLCGATSVPDERGLCEYCGGPMQA